MDFDFKIGAVFSLADDRKESHDSHRTDLYDDPGQSLPDRDEDGKVGINLYGSETNSENTFLSHIDEAISEQMTDYSDKSTESAMSFMEDPDAPPSLLLEDNDSSPFLQQSLNTNIDCISPPILSPEEPLKRGRYYIENISCVNNSYGLNRFN
jgi:hypothetical protein